MLPQPLPLAVFEAMWEKNVGESIFSGEKCRRRQMVAAAAEVVADPRL